MSTYLLLVAGGTGSRMSSDKPKQFIKLHGKAVICHAVEVFRNAIPNLKIIFVSHSDWVGVLTKEITKHFPELEFTVVKGGKTRFHSVKNGLSTITALEESIVLIHDAARPLVSKETIERCIKATRMHGNAIPVQPITESLREVLGESSKPINRENIRAVQTPQCFKVKLIKSAFEQEWQVHFTDDASVAEAAGNKIHLVEGNKENIKITFPEDLEFAEFLLKKKFGVQDQ
jgi:2-C-methyl-D-erythritol 4-phosphate cytidylyltransferase